MAMSIRGLPEDVKESLAENARRQGKSLNAHVVEILSREAREDDPVMRAAKKYAGRFTHEDMLEARRLEREAALDWSMSYDDDPSGRQRDRSDREGKMDAAG